MKRPIWIFLAISLFIAGCAAYKELQPEPPVSFLEAGYIELQDDGEKFELDESNKYFIKFPRPQSENTYLVLSFSDKSGITSYLTRAFDDGKGTIIKMEDLSENPKLLSLYKIDQSVPLYYWVIENVRQDMVLDMTYRYVAIWRYKFETKYAEFEQTLKDNTQSRQLLEDIGKTIELNSINYAGEKEALAIKLKNIENVNSQLGEIKAMLPADILNSQDQAYKDYQALSKQLDDELNFQRSYMKTLDILEIISSPQPDIDKFVTLAPSYTELMKDRSRYPAPFYEAVKQDLSRTLSAVTPHYESVLMRKNDIVPIPVNLKPLKEVYTAAGIPQDQNLGVLSAYIDLFNDRSKTLASVKEELAAINKEITAGSGWPADNFYTDKRNRLSRLSQQLPPAGSDAFGKYKSYGCAVMLDKSISQTKQEIWRLDQQFQRAGLLVGQINQLRRQGDFSGILHLLKQNRDLKFLMSQYAQVDELSLSQQKQAISSALAVNDFHRAENALRDLAVNTDYLNPDLILPRKERLVSAYQDSLYRQVEGVSLGRANEFIETNKTTVDQVDSLYMDKALYPAYTFTYDPTPGFAARQNKALEDKMTYMRTQKFPSTAIDALYRSLTDAMHVQGVEKARAIVIHGSNYQGSDQKLKNLIAECDPGASKWLTKVKQYRKILALPLTTNIGGTNQYMVKINIQIPSDAKFPVYDINIKLPQEVAKHAGSRQWYEKITFNGKLLKNEGRFTITSPDPDNDYIAQISPLQVNKTGNNVLEIRFPYDAFKVLEISVMGQKPIIKKN